MLNAENHPQTAIIIGGGLGGLFTGAILAKNGIAVTIVEKNSTIGGGLQTFRRFGEDFDTGMHVVGGIQEGCNIRRILEYIGVYDASLFENVGKDCADCIFIGEDRQTYRIAAGKEGYIKSLTDYFPHEAENIRQYVDAMYRICEELPLYHLLPADDALIEHSEEFTMPADAFIAKYIKDERLRSLVANINMLYSGEANSTAAFVHAVISVMYLSGPARFIGGSQRLATLLAKVICNNGGQILTNEEVEYVHSEEHNIKYVRTRKGHILSSDYYISDIHPALLFEMLNNEKELPKPYRTRVGNLKNTASAFTVNIKFKKDCFRQFDFTGFYLHDYKSAWHLNDSHKEWPLGFLYMTPPEENQGEFAQKMIITAPMTWDYVRRWEDSHWGNRPEEYKCWKKECLEMILRRMEEIYPDFRTYIDDVNTASPLTIRDFYGVKEGCMSGFAKDYRNVITTQLSVRTKIQNLLLTGQFVSLHGFCGVPLTAIRTSEAILGMGAIMNKL